MRWRLGEADLRVSFRVDFIWGDEVVDAEEGSGSLRARPEVVEATS